MRSQILIVLLAAMASARPVANPDRDSLEIRELQYAEIEALYIERDRSKAGQHHNHADTSLSPHIDAWSLNDGRFPHNHHHGDGHHVHELEEFGHSHDQHHGDGHHGHHPHEFEDLGRPHDHHHGGPHNDILDNIMGFLAHQVRRSVPDASARVMDGLRDFLSHETRNVHEDEHDHHHLLPRHPHPGYDISRHILDFFASATR